MTLRPTKPDAWRPPSPLPGPIRTPRLLIRFWEPADAAGMLEAVNADRAAMSRWLPWAATDNRNVAECTYVIERCRRDREKPGADDFTLGILDHDGAPVGGTGLHRIHAEWSQGEIGYWVRGDRQRQGLCTEAVAHLISAALTPQERGGWGLRRLEIKCAGGNEASQRVPRKIGLREESRLLRQRWTHGMGWDDTLTWGVTAEEWDCGANRPTHTPA